MIFPWLVEKFVDRLSGLSVHVMDTFPAYRLSDTSPPAPSVLGINLALATNSLLPDVRVSYLRHSISDAPAIMILYS